jgi:hypothetical protein
MTEGCAGRGDQVAPYVDGELEPAEAEAFALHLAACPACRAALHDALQLVALEAHATAGTTREAATPEPRPGAARARARGWGLRTRLAIGVAALAIAVLVAIRLGGGGPTADPVAPAAPIVLATAEIRSLEGRISYPAADRHRRYSVARVAAPAPADPIGLDTLAALERRGDLHGVAAAYLLLGDPARATAYLDRAAASPDVAADRALALLTTWRPADALIALDGVLTAAPRHPQALWNRALALRDLGLSRMTVEAFDAVAALGEPGWADEARARGRALADETDARKRLAEQIVAAGSRLATAPDGIPADLARRIPGLTRLYFYDAVRSATSAAAVRALAPLAATLDALAGDHTLTGYVDRIARTDFARRRPLAERYARVVAGEVLDPAAVRDFFGALRAARQDDILLGALILTSPDRRVIPAALVPAYRRLASATGDPWFRLFAIEQEAAGLVARGEFAAAEALAAPALAGCATTRLGLRCVRLAAVLAESYLASLRLSDARRVIDDGVARARRAGEWLIEQRFLPQRADLEMQADDVSATTLPIARAYLDELMRRDPRCATEVWSRRELATMLVNREDFAAARDELARAASVATGCPAAQAFVRDVFVKAQVARDDEISAVRAEIAALRAAPTMTADGEAVLDQTEGKLILGRDRAAGIALLERAIATSSPRANRSVDAHKARSYAYSDLVLDAARAAEWTRVWQLLEREAGAAIERCALGVAVERHRSAVVVRDAGGALAGAYEAARVEIDLDVTHLVPVALRDRLRGCAEIAVLARPPVQGAPGLLPPDVAWSYRSAVGAHGTGSSSTTRLVIANAEPPTELGLSRLLPWRSASVPDVALEGPAATPSRALAALADAGFVEIHAHGMVNTAVSDASSLMLSPDPDRGFALTAAAIRQQPLRGRPIVILAACHAGMTASYRHEPWGLPEAFVEAGARAVIASPDVIADADAGMFFDALRAQIERGSSPAPALRDQRTAWLAAHPDAAWLRSLMVFQ